MDEAMSAVNLARQKYLRTSGKEGKAQQCLNEIAARITYYGEVLDVMAQHHPEYVALAWGAFKFVFIVSQTEQSRSGASNLMGRSGCHQPCRTRRRALSGTQRHWRPSSTC